MNKKLFEKYAELKIKANEIDAEIELLAPQVLDEMKDHDQINSELGSFSKSSRRMWIYPEPIKQMEESLKASKKRSEQTGEATYAENIYLKFSPTKK